MEQKKVADALRDGYMLGTYEDLGYTMDPTFAGKTVDRKTPIAFCDTSPEAYDLTTHHGVPISNTRELVLGYRAFGTDLANGHGAK